MIQWSCSIFNVMSLLCIHSTQVMKASRSVPPSLSFTPHQKSVTDSTNFPQTAAPPERERAPLVARREGGGKLRTGTRVATVGSADGRARRGTTAIRNGTEREEGGKQLRRDGRVDSHAIAYTVRRLRPHISLTCCHFQHQR